MVAAGEIVSVPLPPTVPPDQVVVVAPVRLTLALPLRTPPCMARVGIDCAPVLLKVNVPPEMVRFAESVPANVLLPLKTASVPEPVMLEAASKVRVSLEERPSVVPFATVKVAPLLVSAAPW